MIQTHAGVLLILFPFYWRPTDVLHTVNVNTRSNYFEKKNSLQYGVVCAQLDIYSGYQNNTGVPGL